MNTRKNESYASDSAAENPGTHAPAAPKRLERKRLNRGLRSLARKPGIRRQGRPGSWRRSGAIKTAFQEPDR